MKPGTVVTTRQYGTGMYMYPHEKPVESGTICSFLCRKDKLIYHLPFSTFEPYKDYCWSCDSSVDSSLDLTCDICHWVKCPHCGACKPPECYADSLLLLDIAEPENWEQVTGFDIDSFFDSISESKFHYLGQEEYGEVERCCKALMEYKIRPLLITDDFGMILVYVEKSKEIVAEEILLDIGGSLIPPIILYNPADLERCNTGSCVICGEPTYDGETLCPVCADNIV